MTPTLILILRLLIWTAIGYTLWSMGKVVKARRRALPRNLTEWKAMGSDALTISIAVFGLLILQKNYQEPMDLMASVDPQEINSIEFRDSRTGQLRKLAEWHGQWVILNIWATWCPPCRREMPSLDKVHNASARHGTAVIALSDEPLTTVQKYQLEHPMGFTIGSFSQIPKSLDAIGTRPVSMLITPDGRIVERAVGARGFDFFMHWAEEHP